MVGKSMHVHMVVLMTPDLEKSVEFFKKIGCDLKFHLEKQWAEFAFGDVKIGLWPIEYEGPIEERHTGIVFEIVDAAKAYEEMKALGVDFVKEPTEAIHGIMCSFKEPGGNVFDLYQPTPEKVQEMIHQMREKELAEKAGEASKDCCGKDCCDDCCGDKDCDCK